MKNKPFVLSNLIKKKNEGEKINWFCVGSKHFKKNISNAVYSTE